MRPASQILLRTGRLQSALDFRGTESIHVQSPGLHATQTQQFCLPEVFLTLPPGFISGSITSLRQISIILIHLARSFHLALLFQSCFTPTQLPVSYTSSASCLSLLVLFPTGRNTQQPEGKVAVDADGVSESLRTLGKLERGTESLENTVRKMSGTHNLLFLDFFVFWISLSTFALMNRILSTVIFFVNVSQKTRVLWP